MNEVTGALKAYIGALQTTPVTPAVGAAALAMENYPPLWMSLGFGKRHALLRTLEETGGRKFVAAPTLILQIQRSEFTTSLTRESQE